MNRTIYPFTLWVTGLKTYLFKWDCMLLRLLKIYFYRVSLSFVTRNLPFTFNDYALFLFLKSTNLNHTFFYKPNGFRKNNFSHFWFLWTFFTYTIRKISTHVYQDLAKETFFDLLFFVFNPLKHLL